MDKKELKNKFAIAVKDINGFLSDLESGNIHMPGKIENYKELLDTSKMKVSTTKELNKFIKKMGLSKKECILYWESLISDGYTLMDVEYNKGEVSVLCDNNNIKFLTNARK